jgi:hypothetical protein
MTSLGFRGAFAAGRVSKFIARPARSPTQSMRCRSTRFYRGDRTLALITLRRGRPWSPWQPLLEETPVRSMRRTMPRCDLLQQAARPVSARGSMAGLVILRPLEHQQLEAAMHRAADSDLIVLDTLADSPVADTRPLRSAPGKS